MINRRQFLGSAAGAVAGLKALAEGEQAARPVAPSDRVTLGIIGPGSRGQALMHAFLRVPGVRFAALCDVYAPRFAQAQKVTGEATPTFTDYRRLLEVKDLDAVIVSTPLSLHAEHVVAAAQRGVHIYGEKSLGLTVEDCNQIVAAVERGGKFFQIGHQYHYAPWYEE